MCRMCLSTTAILRSIFTIFRNYNLVFIIRELVKLEIKEDDKLPKSICKSCAVKLIRMREHATLFIDSDRKLRDKLSGSGAELPDVLDELGQKRKRKYTKRTDYDSDSVDGGADLVADRGESDDDDRTEGPVKEELGENDRLDENVKENNFVEISEVKEELMDSDDDDLPLKILSISVDNTDLNNVVKDEEEKPLIIDECKKEDSTTDNPDLSFEVRVEMDKKGAGNDSDDPVALSPMHSDGGSDYEVPVRKTRLSRRTKKELASEPKQKRTYKRRKKVAKVESDTEDDEDVDDEDKDKSFVISDEINRYKKDELDGSEDEAKVKKKRGRKKGTKLIKDPNKPVQKRRPGAPRKFPEPTRPDRKSVV